MGNCRSWSFHFGWSVRLNRIKQSPGSKNLFKECSHCGTWLRRVYLHDLVDAAEELVAAEVPFEDGPHDAVLEVARHLQRLALGALLHALHRCWTHARINNTRLISQLDFAYQFKYLINVVLIITIISTIGCNWLAGRASICEIIGSGGRPFSLSYSLPVTT